MNRTAKIIMAGITAAALAGGGTALAATDSIPDSSGVIHACYKPNANGGMSPLGVIDTALPKGQCPSNQAELDWNQAGPQGPAGPPGQGTSSYVVTVPVSPSSIGVQPGDNLAESVICNTGDHAVGGGGSAADQADSGLVTLDESYPSNSGATDNAWTTDIRNTATSGIVHVVFYAVCAHEGG
jgi:hypothetical protein